MATALGGAVLVIAVIVGAFFLGREQSNASDEPGAVRQFCPAGTPGCDLNETIHEHADFALVIHGERYDFGQKQFISYDGDERSPNVHIHDPRHTVVHVHREHVTWNAFFRTVGFELNDSTLVAVDKASLKLPDGTTLTDGQGGTFKFYMNGIRVAGIADLDIRSMQRVLISFGAESDEQVVGQLALVTDEACIPAGLCPERGNGAGEHGEPCSGQGACVRPR